MKKKLLIVVAALTLAFGGCGASKPAAEVLSEWVESDEVTTFEETINSQFAGTGVHAEFSAEGDDILVFSCIYDEQVDFSGVSQEDIDAAFSSQLSALSSTMTPLFTAFESESGLELSCIRLKYINADGTEIYTYDFTK